MTDLYFVSYSQTFLSLLLLFCFVGSDCMNFWHVIHTIRFATGSNPYRTSCSLLTGIVALLIHVELHPSLLPSRDDFYPYTILIKNTRIQYLSRGTYDDIYSLYGYALSLFYYVWDKFLNSILLNEKLQIIEPSCA